MADGLTELITRDERFQSEPTYRWPKRARRGSVLVCDDKDVVGFVAGGTLAGLVQSGQHTLNAASLPFLHNLERTVGSETIIEAELWFLSLETQRCATSGDLGEIEDLELKVPISSSFNVEMSVRVMDAEAVLSDHAGDIDAIWDILRAQLGRMSRLQLRKCFADDRMTFAELDDEFFQEAAHVEVLPALRSAFARHGFAADDLKLEVEPDVESQRRMDKVLSSIPPALGAPKSSESMEEIDALLVADEPGTEPSKGGPNLGARVRAEAGNNWFAGVVVEIEGDRCLVRWDDAPTTWVATDALVVDEPGTGLPPPDSKPPRFAPSSVVAAEYEDGHPYRARVLRATSGWYEVEWENGYTAWLPEEKLQGA